MTQDVKCACKKKIAKGEAANFGLLPRLWRHCGPHSRPPVKKQKQSVSSCGAMTSKPFGGQCSKPSSFREVQVLILSACTVIFLHAVQLAPLAKEWTP